MSGGRSSKRGILIFAGAMISARYSNFIAPCTSAMVA